MSTSLQSLLVIFFFLFDCEVGFFQQCAKIFPDSVRSIPVELGKEFTATCCLQNNSKYTADDIEWIFGNISVPREFYKKINESAVSVTVNVSDTMANPLKCHASSKGPSYTIPCTYGIYLNKGYPPLKPENLTCIAVQAGKYISPNLTCSWDPGTREPLHPLNYTLRVNYSDQYYKSSSLAHTKSLTVDLKTFPNFMIIDVFVEVSNAFGTVYSEKLQKYSEEFVKPNPPGNVTIIPEDNFPRSLMVNWAPSIDQTTLKLIYNIRYCQAGSSVWTEVPQETTYNYMNSFRLQALQPYTDYVLQVRCINHEPVGYWSEWSSNVTARTPEAEPESGPELWRVYGDNDTVVKLIWKDPGKANGKILAFNITVDENRSNPERLVVQSKEYQLHLKHEKTYVKMTANNSAGVSPITTLVISRPGSKIPDGVKEVSCSFHDGQLWVQWSPPLKSPLEYVLEWVSIPEKERDWQRVPGNLNATVLKGKLKPFTRYNISIYPIYLNKPGKYRLPGNQVILTTYLQEGSPLSGPSVVVTNTQKNSAMLKWDDIPIANQRGFLTNYTIFYKTGGIEKSIAVRPDVFSYKLTDLEIKSQYMVHIMASNKEGSVNGSHSSFYTKKYDVNCDLSEDDGEIEIIVVMVCLGFLFFIVFIMMFSLKNRDVIKKRLWPQVPDPSHSTIASWSPDCPIKADTPEEATLPDVSVVEVDVFDRKSLCEEDKTVLPLKKDKYFSEEHSSGIGGSSCMSSPRQSVSDSDEGDSGQTTASTVLYSSVVASGYKGQIPSLQAPIFVRSESTQPLLGCEEHSEHLLDNSSPQRNSYFKRDRGLEQLQPQEMEETSCFSPMEEEEDTPTLTEDPPGPVPGYMPQQSGYRPQ